MKKYDSLPLVSVIVICYNYGQYVENAINSVLSQTYKNIELIVINDGSTDNSDKVIKKIQKQHKLRYISRENRGVIATRNEAISLVKGDFLLQLDADDTIPENYINELLEHAASKSVDIVYTDYVMFQDRTDRSNFPEYTLEELKNHNFINISALVKTKIIGSKQFDPALANMTHEDWDFFLGLCLGGAVASKCTTTHLNYRIHGKGRNNVLNSGKDMARYAEMFMYITGKYLNDYPREMDYLSGRIFAPWFIDWQRLAEGQQKIILNLTQENNSLNINKAELERKLARSPLGMARRLGRRISRAMKTRLKDD